MFSMEKDQLDDKYKEYERKIPASLTAQFENRTEKSLAIEKF